MRVLEVNNLKKEFNGSILFDKISFDVNTKDKIAVIGKNGVGKSTMIKTIIKEIELDGGMININNQARIGYLSQDVISSLENTLISEMEEIYHVLLKLEKKMHEVTLLMEQDVENIKLMNRYARLEEEYSRLGGYEYRFQMNMVLSKFNFQEADYDRVINTFSGGEKTRVAFAKLLLLKPDMLILDEPTNHLDIEIIEWLEDYLNKYSGALLIVTHDKYFINKVCNKIIEIDQKTSHVFHGNYEHYEVEKVKRYELLVKEYKRQQKDIAHLQSFVDRYRYSAKKATLAQDRIKKINRMTKLEQPKTSNAKVSMGFRERRVTSDVILEIDDLSIGYDKPLMEHISFRMRGIDKVAIIGENGVGKTTLLNVLRKKIKPINGSFSFLREYKKGYFDQNQGTLNVHNTIFNEIQNTYPKMNNLEVRNVAAKFLFMGEDVFKEIRVLSGGERVRLVLLLLMLSEPEFLLLDEPTNHLDLDTKKIIEDVFSDFTGPIIFVSHDRYFINKIASKIIEFRDNIVTEFNGNYSEYRDTFKIEQEKKSKKKQKKPKQVNISKVIDKLECDIVRIEEKIEEVKLSMFLEENYSDKKIFQELEEKIVDLEYELENKYKELINLQDIES